jgi:hypothetical protein
MRVQGEWGNSLPAHYSECGRSPVQAHMWGVGGSALRTHTHTHHQHDNIMGLKTMILWDEDFTHFDRIDKASLLDSNAWYNQFKKNLNKNRMIGVMIN